MVGLNKDRRCVEFRVDFNSFRGVLDADAAERASADPKIKAKMVAQIIESYLESRPGLIKLYMDSE